MLGRQQGHMRNLSFKIRNMDPNNLSKRTMMIKDCIPQQKHFIRT